MRILKFRAWDSLNKKMTPIIDISQSREYWEFDWLGMYDFPIMQFIGLKDVKGVEIYEGDIINSSHDKNMVVGWSVAAGSFCIEKNGWMFRHYFNEAVDASYCKVIGNIYESDVDNLLK